MKLGNMRLGFGRQRAATGGGSAPVISNIVWTEPDLSFDVTGTLPMTVYGQETTSATPPDAEDIKATPDWTEALVLGENVLPALVLNGTPGTYYVHFLVSNAAGDSAIETVSYVVAVSQPSITEYRDVSGFGGTLNVPVGATNAADEIIFACSHLTTITLTVPDFDTIQVMSYGSSRVTVLRWNGGGTRPNSSNVTITLSSSSTLAVLSFVIPASNVAASVLEDAGATTTTHTTGTVTSTNGALVLAVVAAPADVDLLTITGPGTPPAATATPFTGSTQFATFKKRHNASVGVQAIAYTKAGGASDPVTFTSTTSLAGNWILLALEND